MSTTPPPTAAPAAATPQTTASQATNTTAKDPKATTPKKRTPKKATTSKATKAPATPKEENSASPSPPGGNAVRRLTPALKRTIIALKLCGMTTKKISDTLGANYKTVWGYIDKTTKNKAKVSSPDGPSPADMSEDEKKEAALSLKLVGRPLKEISEVLNLNYKSLWAYLDKQQKMAGLPPVTHDLDV